jgi:hypothetical protein
MDMNRLPLVRPKSGQGRYVLLGAIDGLNDRVLLIDVDFMTINTHLCVDDIETIPVAED